MGVSLSKPVEGALLTNAAAQYYESENMKTKILNATLQNNSAGALLATVWIVPLGGAVTNANKVINAKSIAAGETYNCPELVSKNLMPGATLWALESGAGGSIAFMVDGLDQT